MVTKKTTFTTCLAGAVPAVHGALVAVAALASVAAHGQELTFIRCGDNVPDPERIAVEAFEKRNPGVSVDIQLVPWGTCQDKSITLASAGDPVELSYMGSRTLKQLAEADMIVPVELDSAQQASYQPGVLKTVNHRGKFWGFPHAFSTKAMFINCGIVKQAGLECKDPKNWDGLLAMAKTIKEKTGLAGFGLAGKDFDNTMHQFLNFLYSNRGTVIDPDTSKITLDSKETVETLEFIGELVKYSQEGPTAFERSQIKDLYNDGKVAMYMDGPWARGQHNDDIDELTVPIPAGPSGENGTILITDSIAVFKGTGNEKLALELARDLTSGQAQYDSDKDSGLTPIIRYEEFIDDPYYVGDPYWEVYVKPIGSGGPEPLFVEYKSLQTIMNSMIQGMLLGEDSAESLVSIAAEELEEIK